MAQPGIGYGDVFERLDNLCANERLGVRSEIRRKAFSVLGRFAAEHVPATEAWTRLEIYVQGLIAPQMEG